MMPAECSNVCCPPDPPAGAAESRGFTAFNSTATCVVLWILLSSLCIASSPQVTLLGPVTATLTLTPEQPVIGDEIVLEIKVEAEKDVEVLMPEFGEALERYTIVDFVPKQYIAADGQTVLTQRYTLQPFLSGEQSIPPILIEFVDHRPGQPAGPDDYDAYELLTERIDFQVQSVLPDSATAELKPPLGELELRSTTGNRLGWGLITVAVLLLVIAVGGLLFARRARKRVLRRNAYELARQQVDRLIADRQTANPQLSIEQFYIEISAVIRQYLEYRFEVAAPELTTDEFLQLAAAKSELSSEHQQLLAEFLNQADRVKFASGVLSSRAASERDVQRSCELAVRFLEETRENAPDVEVMDDGTTASTAADSNSATTRLPAAAQASEVSQRA